jgi:hypothetical protein
MSGEGPDKSGGVQIPTVIWFTRHIWSKTEHIWNTSLEHVKGIGQVWWTTLALGQVQPV